MRLGWALLAPGGSVLLLALLSGEAAALRTGGQIPTPKPPPKHAAFAVGRQPACPAERGSFPKAAAPPGQLLQVSSEVLAESAEALAADRTRNTSFVRECASAKDRVWNLQPLIIPHLKLAFCYVPKVACTNFKDLFNFLNGYGPETFGFGHHYSSSMPRLMNIAPGIITREHGWKFATFTRDPLLRYLSAFGSTCVSHVGSGFEHRHECCGPTVEMPVPKEELVRRFEERVQLDAASGLVMGDDHWLQQTEILKNCKWRYFKPEKVDYWGHLTGDVNSQVKQMLSIVNYTNDAAVDRFFPKHDVVGHQNPIPYPPQEFFRKEETVKSLVRIFEDDFIKLPGVGCSFTDYILNGTGNSVMSLLKDRILPVLSKKRA